MSESSQNPERRRKRLDSVRELKSALGGAPDLDFPDDRPLRINRFLALTGFGSRRSVEDEYVLKGRVRVGQETASLDTRVAPGDMVFVDDRLVMPPRAALYIAFHKPPGYLVSRKSQGGAPTIYKLLPESLQNLNYAGRLDRFSRGLLLLSQDGQFLQSITHPTFRLTKKYRVKVNRLPEGNFIRAFERGVTHEGEELRAVRVTVIDRKERIVEVVLGQGKNRQIRRMFEQMGARVLDLYRVSIGELDIEKIGLEEGKFIAIDPAGIFDGTGVTPYGEAGGPFLNFSDGTDAE